MRKSFTFLILLILTLNVFAQNNWCGSDQFTKEMRLHDPLYREVLKKLQTQAVNFMSSTNSLNDTLPIVVHVIDNFAPLIVTDADVHTMINTLNTDFAKLNADTNTLPAPFLAIAGSLDFRFKIVERDSNGAMTTGINRVTSTHAPFSTSYQDKVDMQSTALGGSDRWSTFYFFNIYITDLDPSIGGFATIGGPFIAIDVSSVLGRAITHEMGHALGLSHIWGGSSGSCTDDDNISDTPLQWGPSTTCHTFPYFDSCTTSGNGIMYVNYMDYTTCAAMFTQGQCTAMINTYNTYYSYYHYSNSPAIKPVLANDAGCVEILSPIAAGCTQFIPTIKFRNWGSSAMTSATVYYKIDNNSVQSQAWSGHLTNYQSDIMTFPAITLAPGTHTFTVYTGNPNGVTDQDHMNDTLVRTIVVNNGLTIPLTQGFENSVFPPADWSINNPQNNITWNSSYFSHSGQKAMVYFNHYMPSMGDVDEISLLANISGASQAYITFYRAHTWQVLYGYSDTLEINVSDNCGASFTQVYRNFGTSLATAPATTDPVEHYYPVASEYVKDSIDLSPFTSSTDPLIVTFKVINGQGKELYVDDILINAVNVGISELEDKDILNLYPNPSEKSLTISIPGWNSAILSIVDIQSKVVFSKYLTSEKSSIDINLASGIYIATVKNGNEVKRKKIIIQ